MNGLTMKSNKIGIRQILMKPQLHVITITQVELNKQNVTLTIDWFTDGAEVLSNLGKVLVVFFKKKEISCNNCS